jgi:hypothetical protein
MLPPSRTEFTSSSSNPRPGDVGVDPFNGSYDNTPNQVSQQDDRKDSYTSGEAAARVSIVAGGRNHEGDNHYRHAKAGPIRAHNDGCQEFMAVTTYEQVSANYAEQLNKNGNNMDTQSSTTYDSAKDRRLAQNRKTAQVRRNRNREYLDQLQMKKDQLLQQQQELQYDNASIRRQIAGYRATLNQIQLQQPPLNTTAMPFAPQQAQNFAAPQQLQQPPLNATAMSFAPQQAQNFAAPQQLQPSDHDAAIQQLQPFDHQQQQVSYLTNVPALPPMAIRHPEHPHHTSLNSMLRPTSQTDYNFSQRFATTEQTDYYRLYLQQQEQILSNMGRGATPHLTSIALQQQEQSIQNEEKELQSLLGSIREGKLTNDFDNNLATVQLPPVHIPPTPTIIGKVTNDNTSTDNNITALKTGIHTSLSNTTTGTFNPQILSHQEPQREQEDQPPRSLQQNPPNAEMLLSSAAAATRHDNLYPEVVASRINNQNNSQQHFQEDKGNVASTLQPSSNLRTHNVISEAQEKHASRKKSKKN